ncbi:MAG TPA: sigma-70 family RNA polymerase sigma factor [Pyrinomonadaceae bacterium]
MSSEKELIRLAQGGDSEAFCLLAEAYERRLYSLAFHFCRDRRDAEDLSQEVWLKAYSAVSSFRFESSFYTWLRKIAINCFLNYRRTAASKHQLHEQVTDDSAIEQTLSWEKSLHNQLVIERVMQALSDVTPQQRLIFLLKHQEGLTYEEISRSVGCSVGTVKKSVARTITKLRERLRANEEPETYVSYTAAGIMS